MHAIVVRALHLQLSSYWFKFRNRFHFFATEAHRRESKLTKKVKVYNKGVGHTTTVHCPRTPSHHGKPSHLSLVACEAVLTFLCPL
jgi:hypothetical protein